jgi:hypothetical protein
MGKTFRMAELEMNERKTKTKNVLKEVNLDNTGS